MHLLSRWSVATVKHELGCGGAHRAEEALSDRMEEMAHHKRQTAALLMRNALANIGKDAAVCDT